MELNPHQPHAGVYYSMCELASEFLETRIHANLCELKREPPLVSFTENPVKIQSELKRELLLVDGTKDNRLKIWENYYHVVFFTAHKKEP